MWHLYIVRCPDGSLYTGIAKDVSARFAAHQSNKGARRLRGRSPLELVFQQPVGTRSVAQRLEYRVKRLDRRAKQDLVDGKLALAVLAEAQI